LIKEQISLADVGVRMIVVAGAVVENGVSGIDEGNRGERPAGRSREKFRVQARNAEILRAPQSRERNIGIKIVRAYSRGGKAVPDGRERTDAGAIGQAVGLRGVQEQPIRKSRAKDGSEITIAGGVVAGQRRVERDVLFAVIADAIDIVAPGAQKAIHRTLVILNACAVVRMVRIGMRTAGIIAGERIRRVTHAGAVHVRQTGLFAVRVRQPSEKMIETAVLHGHNDDVFDA